MAVAASAARSASSVRPPAAFRAAPYAQMLTVRVGGVAAATAPPAAVGDAPTAPKWTVALFALAAAEYAPLLQTSTSVVAALAD